MDLNENPNIKHFQKGKKHYFSILREDGKKALLTSKGYGSAKTRDNGLQTFINNLERLEQEEKNDHFYFLVKTGNNHILAKSVPFFSDHERQQAIDLLMQLFDEQEGTVPAEAEAEEEQKTADLPPKYSFRLEFYVSEEQKPVRGKIEYPFTKEKKAFNGIDMATIETFLRNYLPATLEEESKKMIAAGPSSSPPALPANTEKQTATMTPSSPGEPNERTAPAAAPTTRSKGSVSPASNISGKPAPPRLKDGIPISPSAAALDFSFIDQQTGAEAGPQLRRSGPNKILLDLDRLEFSRDVYTDLSVSIFGMPLETGKKQLLGRNDFKTSPRQEVIMPLDLARLPGTGTCKFELLIRL
ncbi:MAG: hypothetical protein KDD04_04430, partial [Sinomicrobium sp.]|nr:hypothetical protein [Sinomicrobium sp.]